MVAPARAASKISLVLADVDGTLVTEEKVLTSRAEAAVKALQDRRHRLCDYQWPAAARHGDVDRSVGSAHPGCRFQWRDLRQARYDHHGRARACRRCRQSARSRSSSSIDMDVWVYSGKDWLVRDPNAPHVAREQWTVKFAPTVVENFEGVLSSAVKIVGVSDDLDLVARCEKDAQDALGAKASAARSQPYYLDVTHPDANKGTVVTTLSKLLSIPTSEIATIGDMPNDVLMFRKSGLSIAMGNASPEVQAQADLVTDSYDDEGFAKAIERFILPRTSSALPRAS